MLHYVELIQVTSLTTSIKVGPLNSLFLNMVVFPFIVITNVRQGYLGVGVEDK